ncbi:piggyBac transposable element-derived protein 1 [Trichonephila clavata]|uniref:PiggyBac transposable element-derived protein 1 n=1 Tax=Trichonephila clavata TaxID=2740835 RepID=A0A8X6HZN9_TRICU|nr:piggyBac transposable element-derived protein 1 [Trichonephila clavata]
MVRYYGHRFLKQFIRGKSIRFVFKQWAMCCGVTGYCYNADIYEGKPSRISEEDNLEGDTYGLGVSVILNKISTIDKPEEHCFYFDNFFTSFDLLKNLKERNIPATGTVRCNRMNKCPIKKDKEMKKEFRGAFDYRYDEINGIFGLVWKGITALLKCYQIIWKFYLWDVCRDVLGLRGKNISSTTQCHYKLQ